MRRTHLEAVHVAHEVLRAAIMRNHDQSGAIRRTHLEAVHVAHEVLARAELRLDEPHAPVVGAPRVLRCVRGGGEVIVR
jgi:hypothetical protein